MSIRAFSVVLIGGIFLAVSIYAGVLIYIAWPIENVSIDKTGVFGDSFGLLTSLFSGLAFSGLIITILMQREELALQREELGLTRKEISGQKEELKAQNETLTVQRFENTFFQMLEILESCRNDITHKYYGGTGNARNGRDAVKTMYSELSGYGFHQQVQVGFDRKYVFDERCLEIDGVNEYYCIFYSNYGEELGQYFRTLYNILKLIERSAPQDDKNTYSNLLRAQLSTYELLLLFYNCLSELGAKMRPLVKKFNMLKHMEANLLIEQHSKLWCDWKDAS